MESRRVVLLTEGFLRGWLDFSDKTQLSRLREEYLLSVIERRLLSEKVSTKLAVFGNVACGQASQKGVAALTKELSEYFELTLPYMAEKTKIRSKADSAKLNSPAFWKALLDKRKADLSKEGNTTAP